MQVEEEFRTFSEEELSLCLIYVYLDVAKMAHESLPSILSDLVWPNLTLEPNSRQYFIDSLDEGRKDLISKLATLSKVITDRVSTKSCSYLKQVSDIPRLYRRTNRELPSKPCTYLVALLDPIQKFKATNEVELK